MRRVGRRYVGSVARGEFRSLGFVSLDLKVIIEVLFTDSVIPSCLLWCKIMATDLD